jgi:hypothetical protein
MLVDNSSLNDVATMALEARARGASTIDFEIEAQQGFARFVELWEGIIGDVVDRVFEALDTQPIPGMVRPRTVKYFRVRAQIASVLEAQRRRARAEIVEFGTAP